LTEARRASPYDADASTLRMDFGLVSPSTTVAPMKVASLALGTGRSEEHTSELQSLRHLVCRLLLEKKNKENLRARSAQAS